MTRLRPMTTAQFDGWLRHAVPAYAAEKLRAGEWAAPESLPRAEAAFRELLPQGLQTPGQRLYGIESEDGGDVGALWLARTERAGAVVGHVYDLVVWPPHRRQGHATRALRALEAEAAGCGMGALALHVFGHNLGARRLYAALGYEPTDLNLLKRLSDR